MQGHTFQVVDRLVGNGSALVEDQFPGSDHEMLTVCHLDGDELRMTHYRASGNQPRTRQDRAGSTAKDLFFAFDGGTNFDPAKDSPCTSCGRSSSRRTGSSASGRATGTASRATSRRPS